MSKKHDRKSKRSSSKKDCCYCKIVNIYIKDSKIVKKEYHTAIKRWAKCEPGRTDREKGRQELPEGR